MSDEVKVVREFEYALTMDIVFKAVFGRDTDKCRMLLVDLLNSILGTTGHVPINTVEIKNPFMMGGNIVDKKPVLDIRAKTDTGEHINIEIQVCDHKFFNARMVYYLTKIHSEQLEAGDDFGKITKTITIAILKFNLTNIGPKSHQCFRLKEIDSNDELTDDVEMHYVQLPLVNDTIDVDGMDHFTEWMTVVKDLSDPAKVKVIHQLMEKREVIQVAINEYKTITSEAYIREALFDQEKAERDRISIIAEAKEIGMEQGIEQGIEKGIEKGIEQGIEKGIEQGMKKGMEKMIHNMKQKGYSIEIIADTANLSIDEVEKIVNTA